MFSRLYLDFLVLRYFLASLALHNLPFAFSILSPPEAGRHTRLKGRKFKGALSEAYLEVFGLSTYLDLSMLRYLPTSLAVFFKGKFSPLAFGF